MTNDEYIDTARGTYVNGFRHDGGSIEIDEGAAHTLEKDTNGDGAWVRAWVFVRDGED